MKRQRRLSIAIKPINMKGGGYSNFLDTIKTDSNSGCLAKFIIIDGDLALNKTGEKKNLKELIDYCIVQNKSGRIPHFLIVDFPDFEYLACLHTPQYKNQNTEQYIIRNLGYNSLEEFKSDTKEKNGLPDSELIDAIVGMTNAEGGILYLGVEDDGEITGLTKQHKDAIGVMTLIANSTVPTVSTRAEIITENKKDILRIEVPKARTVTATSKGKTLRRRLKFDGSPEAVPLFPYEIPSRLSELSLLDFSAQPLEGATEEDLDVLEFERLKSIIKNSIGSDKSLL